MQFRFIAREAYTPGAPQRTVDFASGGTKKVTLVPETVQKTAEALQAQSIDRTADVPFVTRSQGHMIQRVQKTVSAPQASSTQPTQSGGLSSGDMRPLPPVPEGS